MRLHLRTRRGFLGGDCLLESILGDSFSLGSSTCICSPDLALEDASCCGFDDVPAWIGPSFDFCSLGMLVETVVMAIHQGIESLSDCHRKFTSYEYIGTESAGC